MDPDVTLALLRDPTTDPEDRYDAAIALTDWINAGGFLPAGEIDDVVDELSRIRTSRPAAADTHLEAAYDDAQADEVAW